MTYSKTKSIRCRQVRYCDPELFSLDPEAEALEELRLLEVLPVALKKKEPEFPHLLEIRTRKNFHIDTRKQKKMPHNSNYEQEIKEVVLVEPTEAELKQVEQLKNVFSFLTENKYVVEAIFENVLLENKLFKFPLSELTETERKQLMEKLLMNEEFKEYVYQKILRDQDSEKEGANLEGSNEHKHLISDAMTQDEGLLSEIRQNQSKN